jgi:hypothetical protein
MIAATPSGGRLQSSPTIATLGFLAGHSNADAARGDGIRRPGSTEGRRQFARDAGLCGGTMNQEFDDDDAGS